MALGIGSFLFARDANFVIIRPVQRMIEKIQRIAKNPLEAASSEDKEALVKEREEEEQTAHKAKLQASRFQRIKAQLCSCNSNSDQKSTEDIAVLEQTIVKVGALVALGFGEAGVKIISDNMEHNGEVDPMIPGQKVVAIFGFCNIRHFNETTDVLEEQILTYVN